MAITGGGTAGHVYPGLAVAAAWRAAAPGVDVLFLGTAGGIESRLVPAHGHRFAAVRAAPLLRVGAAGKLRALAATLAGAAAARRLLRAERVRLVLGFGGYASGGVVLAARSLHIPVALHEANAVAGVANRWLGRLADRVLLGFASARRDFAAARSVVTGTPVRREILAVARKAPREAGAPLQVLVMGGSGGSRFLDARAPDLLARVAAGGHAVAACHLVGSGDLEATRAAYARAGVPATVVPYEDDMAGAWAWADFAITCAGALTLAETAAAGVPALLVPLAGAALDHQAANAREFARATGAWWTREAAWDAEALAARVASLAASPAVWATMAEGVRRAARPRAAEAVIAACEALPAAR